MALGTTWVARYEGSTWRQLCAAFADYKGVNFVPSHGGEHDPGGSDPRYDRHTNLLLTGETIKPYDRQRWESGNVE